MAKTKQDLSKYRGRSIVVPTPTFIFTPIKDTKGQTSGIEIDITPSPTHGLIGGYIYIPTGRDEGQGVIGELDFSGMSARDVRAEVNDLINRIKNGTLGKRDIRDIINNRGGVASARDPIPAKTEDVEVRGGAMPNAKTVLIVIITYVSLRVADWAIGKALDRGWEKMTGGGGSSPEKPAKESPPDKADAGVPPGDNPPKDDPKKTPAPDEGGKGKPTAQQIHRVYIKLKDFVPPYRDDRDPKDKSPKGTDKKSPRYNGPAINWGENDPTLKKSNVSYSVVYNDGYTDPIRE
jgi:hypothetical protein